MLKTVLITLGVTAAVGGVGYGVYKFTRSKAPDQVKADQVKEMVKPPPPEKKPQDAFLENSVNLLNAGVTVFGNELKKPETQKAIGNIATQVIGGIASAASSAA